MHLPRTTFGFCPDAVIHPHRWDGYCAPGKDIALFHFSDMIGLRSLLTLDNFKLDRITFLE